VSNPGLLQPATTDACIHGVTVCFNDGRCGDYKVRLVLHLRRSKRISEKTNERMSSIHYAFPACSRSYALIVNVLLFVVADVAFSHLESRCEQVFLLHEREVPLNMLRMSRLSWNLHHLRLDGFIFESIERFIYSSPLL
jgi:hypothetical protein